MKRLQRIHELLNKNFEDYVFVIKDNSKYDDMMHIVYSDNIQILNSKNRWKMVLS